MERIPSCLLHNSANDDFGRPTVPGSRIPAQGTGLAQGMAAAEEDKWVGVGREAAEMSRGCETGEIKHDKEQ